MLADSLQTELRKLIAGHRVSCGVCFVQLSCCLFEESLLSWLHQLSAAPFDDQLEYVLGSSLSVYELVRSMPCAF
jgi:hypothetical protein